ncbi:MAG TPA: DUF4157 domain-containing protein [Kofleriaceae bacterium]|nr:DUF4157 domain-containing protein [Kofleriaceae bacterium]
MADFEIDLGAQAAAPAHHEEPEADAPQQIRAARKIARKAIALSALADSLAGGGAKAGADMAVSRKTASDVAEDGFSGTAHEVPYRKEMEKSFGGADFSGVKAYSDGPARKASNDLGAEAYAAGTQVAFNSPNPDKATVAHELTHVLQNTGGAGVQRKADGGEEEGIETSGEEQADKVEKAVKDGKTAKSAINPDSAQDEGHESEAEEGHHGEAPPAGKAAQRTGPARKGRPALEESGSKFGMGMSFSPEGMEKSYQYELWKAPPIEIPIVAVPGLNFMVEPSVVVKAAGGVNWKKKQLKAALGVEGGVGVGLSYGNAAVCSLYAVMEAKAAGGFEYTKDDNNWELEGAISLSTNFKVGVKLAGGILDYGFEFGKCEIGKLTGLMWKNGHFEKDKIGWEWGEKPKEFFAAIKAAINKAKQLLEAGAEMARKAWNKAKQVGSTIYNAGAAAVNWVTSW